MTELPKVAVGKLNSDTVSSSSGLPSIKWGFRRIAVLLLKMIATVAICYWIFTHVAWQELWASRERIQPWAVLLMVSLHLFGTLLSAAKWRELLLIHGLSYRFSDLTRWYFVSRFLSQFLPTNIGGDTYRVYKTFENDRGGYFSITAVVLDRITGMLALLTMGFIAGIFCYFRTGNQLAEYFIVAGVASGAIAILVGLVFATFVSLKDLCSKLKTLRWIGTFVTACETLIADFRVRPYSILLIASLSFSFHLIRIFTIWVALYQLGVTVNFTTLVFAGCIVEVVALLPISLGGVGVIEGSFMYIMGTYGVPQVSTLTAMVLVRVIQIPGIILGAYFYFLARDSKKCVELGQGLGSKGAAGLPQP